MKVLVFTSQIHRLGGAEKLAVELVEGLNAQPGVQADLLVMVSGDVPGTEETKQRLINNGVQSVRFLGRRPDTRGRSMLRFILKLRRILQTGDYGFIETSMLGPTILASWATLGLPTRLVFGIHEIYRRDYQKSWSYKFLRFSVKFNQNVQFYAISKQALQSWLEYTRMEPERIRVIYNSIAADFFERKQDGVKINGIPDIGSGERKALFVGRLCLRKGLDTLIDAIGPVLNKEKIHLFIVGGPNGRPDPYYPGDADLLERLSKQIADNGWFQRVHFLGIRDDVPQIMRFADVLVHPTRDEGFGLVLVEALAEGLPIVTTDVGGIPEVLVDTDSVLVPPDDPVALRNACLEILHRTPEEAALCRRRTQQRAEFFRPERRIADMMALFYDLYELKAK
jgi:glycosyltransferase involved in cell wall biosynthesis